MNGDDFGLHEGGVWLPWGVLDEMPVDLAKAIRGFSLEDKAGGHDKNRGNAERLRRYWSRGEGAAKIGWGAPGDFYRCVAHTSKYMGERAKGYCANRHKEATGAWPGHAATEQGGKAPKGDRRAAEAGVRAFKGKKGLDVWDLDPDYLDEFDEWDFDEDGNPYDDTHPEVIAAFEAEEKAYLAWAASPEGKSLADSIELKAFRISQIFDLPAWTRNFAKDAAGWLKRLYRSFGKRQQEALRQTLEELHAAVGEIPPPSTAGIITGQAPRRDMLDPASIPADFDVELPDVRAAIDNRINLLSAVDNVTHQRVMDTLAEGEAEGESIDELADRIQEVFQTSDLRAAVIARTEVNAAANNAQEIAAQRNGALTKTWIAVEDPRTRSQHRWVDGDTVWIGSRYMVPVEIKGGAPAGFFPMSGPGDSFAPPQLTVNCRCTQAYGFNIDYDGAPESPEWRAKNAEKFD